MLPLTLDPKAPVWIAIASRGATVAENVPEEETENLEKPSAGTSTQGRRTTDDEPEQLPPLAAPLTTSQYVPAGSDVENIAVQSESWLLIAVKPRLPIGLFSKVQADENGGSHAPRPKAICCDVDEYQFVNAAEPTWLRKPTIPAIAGQRCWQSLYLISILIISVESWANQPLTPPLP